MLAVRYVALAALVVWLGGMVTVVFGDLLRPYHVVALVCGAVILVSLFVMKFVGPPPHAFVPRASLTALMLLILGVSALFRSVSGALMAVNLTLGFLLLFWYVRE
ncbi:MAG: hypothetical protein AUF76_08035 [Acidobacteria bacterium 13_1_20CM_2_65_9]|nr:MAG: hypothetical protein AUF76_08035 [Acidobacteria bacterium 13_1_20CM_2_65_9]